MAAHEILDVVSYNKRGPGYGMPGRGIASRGGLYPCQSQNSKYEFQQFQELLKKDLPAMNWEAFLLFFALYPTPVLTNNNRRVIIYYADLGMV
jgi:hypothetical protein